MLKLRHYQKSAVDDIRGAFASGTKRVVLCKPTGAGKTVTFADMAVKTVSKGARVMVLCDRKELINQAKDKLEALGLLPTVIAPGFKQIENQCYLASVDTLRRREFPKIDLLIVDEAHKQSFDKVIHRYIEFCNPFIIGATATPLRTGNQNCLSSIYQKIIEPITIEELLEEGFLVPAKTYAAKEDFSDVKKKGNDFDNSALFNKFDAPQLYDGVVDNWFRFARDKKTICFNVNVEHSKKTCAAFRASGVRAKHIDGNTPNAERKAILEAFARGDFEVLCNCSILTTGFDEPSIEAVIVNRATLSLPLWLQMVGRGSRTFTNKENFVVLDHGGNVFRFGLWEEPREWSIVKKKKRKGDGVAPVKCCESCGAINHASARICKFCEVPFPIKKKVLKKSEFIEISKKMKRRGVVEQNGAGFKPKWAYNSRRNRGVQ